MVLVHVRDTRNRIGKGGCELWCRREENCVLLHYCDGAEWCVFALLRLFMSYAEGYETLDIAIK